MLKTIFLFSILLSSFLAADELEDLVSKEFKSYSSNHSYFDNVKNQFVGHNLLKRFDLNDSETLLLYETTKDDFKCHVCAPKTNWFYFVNDKNKWILKSKIINSDDSIGSWGELMIPELIKAKKEDFIIKYTSSYVAQGVLEEHLILYSFSKGKFTKVFNELISFSDSGMYEVPKNEWESKISFNENKSTYPDLIIQSTGIKDSKNISTKKIYKYVNNKYRFYK